MRLCMKLNTYFFSMHHTMEYAQRKQIAEEVNALNPSKSKNTQLGILQIIKDSGVEYTENVNGVFIDITELPANVCIQIQSLLELGKQDIEFNDTYNRAVNEANMSIDNGCE